MHYLFLHMYDLHYRIKCVPNMPYFKTVIRKYWY